MNEEKLFKITSTMLMDYSQFLMKMGVNIPKNLTVANLNNFARAWIQDNIKEFNESQNEPE